MRRIAGATFPSITFYPEVRAAFRTSAPAATKIKKKKKRPNSREENRGWNVTLTSKNKFAFLTQGIARFCYPALAEASCVLSAAGNHFMLPACSLCVALNIAREA